MKDTFLICSATSSAYVSSIIGMTYSCFSATFFIRRKIIGLSSSAALPLISSFSRSVMLCYVMLRNFTSCYAIFCNSVVRNVMICHVSLVVVCGLEIT